MGKNIGTFRTKTRYKLKKEPGMHGKLSISRYFQHFKEGEKVHLIIESSVHKGMYFPRFMGRTGIIKGKKGKCYQVEITDGGKKKILISHPIHLKRAA
tara:strand:- start:1779 stop:2072 length:294 start_codon:yes stop_codon:yes gene_type:complete